MLDWDKLLDRDRLGVTKSYAAQVLQIIEALWQEKTTDIHSVVQVSMLR